MSERIERDYIDNFSTKELVVDQLVPKFFPDVPVSNLTTGTIGMIVELISTITEDSFNTGSSLVAESFPTRAKMDSSIFSNAAIFQFTNTFSVPSSCELILGIPEVDIRENFQRKPGSNYYYFYIDKDTVVEVEGKPFTLDYDIEVTSMYKESEKGWIYTAKYITDEYKNSVSELRDPYVRLKKMKNGMVIFYVTARQYQRTVAYEPIVDNTTVNYPTINVTYSGKLAGFDVFYKGPNDTDYNTQLTPKVIYSIPSKEPFCYYKQIDDHTYQLSFTTKDAYFQPAFNSELKIVTYTTLGEEGNFEAYDGDIIEATKGTNYEYENSWMLTARVLSAGVKGKEAIDIEGLRALTVEGYSTAKALGTENDLETYFKNYQYRYGNKMLFLKKRNDAVELLFSAFMLINKDNYIYPTNTLTMDTNILEFDYKSGGFYNLEPGYLFSYKEEDAFYIPVYYYITGTEEYYDSEGHYYDEKGERDEERDITDEQLQRRIQSKSVVATDKSYWMRSKTSVDHWNLHFENGSVDENTKPITTDEIMSLYHSGEISYGTHENGSREIDFLKDMDAENEAKIAYMDYYETYKEEQKKPTLTYNEYLFEYTFKEYKRERGIDNRLNVFDTNFENFKFKRKFMFTNPFIMTVTENTGLISYYQTFISKDAILDFVNQNDDDAFVQFIAYTFHMNRDISKDKKYHFYMTVTPSITQTEEAPYVSKMYDPLDRSLFILSGDDDIPAIYKFKREILVENRFRIILTFSLEGVDIGYYEMIPTSYDEDSDQYVFEGEIYTDDYITTENNFQIVHKCPHCGSIILNSSNFTNEGKKYFCDKCENYFDEGIVNIRETDTLMLPIDGINVKITTLFKDPQNDESPVTDNGFVQYHEQFQDYIWTNEYNTSTDPLTMIEPLDMVRSTIAYKDFYVHGVDAMDCTIQSIPLLKYSILAYKEKGMKVTDPLLRDDIGKFQYFMDSYLNNYELLREANRYLGGMHIDCKWYNTYGKSTNYIIGNEDELIDTNNISIYLDVWLIANADKFDTDKRLRLFIKTYIETINEKGVNNLYISNLIRQIEQNFAQVDHLEFKGINDYDITYQSIENVSIDLEKLSKDQRRKFVPDILVINDANIFINYYQDEI